jgi:uncharacterized protein
MMDTKNHRIQAIDKVDARKIAKDYISFLKNSNTKIVKAILFGSYAKGNDNENSDIDIAVIYQFLEDKFSAQVQLLMLTPKFDTRIEPHPMELKELLEDTPLANEIRKYGIEIE